MIVTAKRNIALGEYYHVFNRGAHKQGVFRTEGDWRRFLFNILYFQSPVVFPNLRRVVATYSDQGFEVNRLDFEHVLEARGIELVAFCLMPNHYHLLVRELREGGISAYMQRSIDAYTRYFNTKYETSGHVFQGSYKSVHVESNEQLLHLSAYIHKNPRELKAWRGKEAEYPYSSYRDYVKENRWGGLLAQEIILDQFEGTRRSNYAGFVKTSKAKEI